MGKELSEILEVLWLSLRAEKHPNAQFEVPREWLEALVVAARERDRLRAALRRISEGPEGAYSRDRETYLKNVIEWCQELARDALAVSEAKVVAMPRGIPQIVCLCGSGRFSKEFKDAESQETLLGKIVLTIGCNTKDVARDMDWSHVKPMLDELHLRKIDLADEILVLNVGGYIGDSTQKEIEYATKQGKRIRYLEAIN